jgi:hypothetical protein
MIQGRYEEVVKVKKIQAFDNLTLLVTFNNDEKRIFDLDDVLDLPAFKELENLENFKSAFVRNGVVAWLNGKIDLAPQTMYTMSYDYDESEIVEA